MVYQSGFVVCVLVKGKVSAELNGIVELNEGDEYTVRLRNKTDRRAACELFIDGELQGNYVVNAKSFVDVERSVDRNAAFKFTHIDSGESINEGKNKLTADSGKITAKFKFERIEPVLVYQPVYINPQPWINPTPWKYPGDYHQGWKISGGGNPNITCRGMTNQDNVLRVTSCNTATFNQSVNEIGRENIGVTVDGGKTAQSFYTTYFSLEYSYAAIIDVRLVLANSQKQHILSRGNSIYCSQCGTLRESRAARFCVNCGHKLKT